MTLKIIDAPRNALITESGFSGYDCCLNPYVGCEFGCSYCYVRFFIKDEEAAWGDFVKVRRHITTKLPNQVGKWVGKRLVIGTMTDPYMPIERRYRLTRRALEIIVKEGRFAKVGIFTRSPIILDDIDLIKTLPRPRVHFTVSPFPREAMVKIEPIAIQTSARFAAMKKLKQAGIRVHANIAPAIPFLSTKEMVDEYVKALIDAGVDEFFVDPMQAYAQSFDATFAALKDDPDWDRISATIKGKHTYDAWKALYKSWWMEAWKPHRALPILPIWSDHQSKAWVDMRTDTTMDRHHYGDDIGAI